GDGNVMVGGGGEKSRSGPIRLDGDEKETGRRGIDFKIPSYPSTFEKGRGKRFLNFIQLEESTRDGGMVLQPSIHLHLSSKMTHCLPFSRPFTCVKVLDTLNTIINSSLQRAPPPQLL